MGWTGAELAREVAHEGRAACALADPGSIVSNLEMPPDYLRVQGKPCPAQPCACDTALEHMTDTWHTSKASEAKALEGKG